MEMMPSTMVERAISGVEKSRDRRKLIALSPDSARASATRNSEPVMKIASSGAASPTRSQRVFE